jgi:hypothetical protein
MAYEDLYWKQINLLQKLSLSTIRKQAEKVLQKLSTKHKFPHGSRLWLKDFWRIYNNIFILP